MFPVIVADKVASLPLCIAVAFGDIAFLFGLNEVCTSLPTTLGAPPNPPPLVPRPAHCLGATCLPSSPSLP